MPIPQHVEHFTAVLNRMDGHMHLRRIVAAACGRAFWSDKATTFDAGGCAPEGRPTKSEAILTNSFARGSDALFDTGSVARTVEQMKADPLAWGYIWHVQANDERWDMLSDCNLRTQSYVVDLYREDRIGDPLDVVRFKLLGVYTADAIEHSPYAQRGMTNINERPFVVSRKWLRRALAPEFFRTVGQMVRQDVAEAMDAQKKRATQ